MKFTANRKHLADALKTAAACVGRNSVIPLLSNALFEAKDGKVTITCTNLEQRITASFAADVATDGITTFPALKLLNLLGILTGDSVSIITNDHVSEITCGTTFAKIAGIDPKDYPEKTQHDPIATFSIDCKELASLFARGAYAVSNNDARKALTGVLFEVSAENISVVSTDGKRLALLEYACAVQTEETKQFIIPAAAIAMMNRFKGDKAEFTFAENYVDVKVGGIDFQSKLIQAKFPNYKAVVPATLPEKVEINAVEFLAKLSIVSAMTSATDQIATFTLDGEKLKMSAGGSEGIIDDSMNINTSSPFTTPVQMNFNPAFLTAAVSACSEGNFTMLFKDGAFPALFEFGNNSKAVIMPIRPK